MRSRILSVGLMTFAWFAVVHPSHAADLMTPSSQSRGVVAEAGVSGDEGSDSDDDSDFAVDFGVFDSAVEALAT